MVIQDHKAYKRICLAIILQALRDIRPIDNPSKTPWIIQSDTAAEFFDSGMYKVLCENIDIPPGIIYQGYLDRLEGKNFEAIGRL
mgnify:CR=1 FL=1